MKITTNQKKEHLFFASPLFHLNNTHTLTPKYTEIPETQLTYTDPKNTQIRL